MTSAGANTWSVPLELNNLESQIAQIGAGAVQSVSVGNTNITLSGTAQNPILSGTLTDLTGNVAGNNNYIAGMYAPPFGTSAIVCAGTDTFLIEDTAFVPLLAVANTGLVLGGGGTLTTVPVQAPTVTPSTDNSTNVATTAFVQSVVSAIPAPATPTLSTVLTAGNTATNSITLNNTGVGANTIKLLPNNGATDPHIEVSDGTTTNTIDKNGYTTRNSVQNITHYLNFSDSSSTGTGAIQKTAGISCNPSTNIVSATTFSGALSGNATSATNLAGGAGGSIPYQSAVNTTALLANGTSGQVLTSQGTTLAPIWTTPSGGSQTLAQVLTTGNSAGSTAINMNSQDITAVNNLTVASPYNFSVISIYTDATARDTALPTPYLGQMCLLTGTNALQFYKSGWLTLASSIPITATIGGFTLGVNYEIIYVDSLNTVVLSPVVNGFTIVRFYPTAGGSGTISLSETTNITYLVVGGGGGGGGVTINVSNGGGGGAGDYRASTATMVGSNSYALTVGAGGAGGTPLGSVGGSSSLAVVSGTITAVGGGGGGSQSAGGSGGSGGGAGGGSASFAGGFATGVGGVSNGGSYTFTGVGAGYYSGGGGGSTSGGSPGDTTSAIGNGGNGTANIITGASVVYAGGGGGGSNGTTGVFAVGGTGGGGSGGNNGSPAVFATAGTNGRGSGGGGGGNGLTSNPGASGGAGVVIVRFASFV